MDNAYIGWEKALIGTVLHRPEEMTKAEDVRPNDLTGCHQMLWAAMLGLYRNESLEPRALIETLRERSLLDKMYSFDDPTVSGETYILELIAARGGNNALCSATAHPMLVAITRMSGWATVDGHGPLCGVAKAGNNTMVYRAGRIEAAYRVSEKWAAA